MNNTQTSIISMDCPCKGKNLDKLLQPTILLALSEGPMYAIDVVDAVSRSPLCRGTAPDTAGVYRYLKRMESSGLLSSRWENGEEDSRPKRLYAVTPHGEACRRSWIDTLRGYVGSIEDLIGQLERADQGTGA